VRPEVVFTVIFLKDGKHLACPTVLSEFGREARVEIPDEMRVVVLAMSPNQEGRCLTSATMSLFKDGAWRQVKEMTMEAYLSITPSFEYSVPDTAYRFVVMPRRIVPVSPDGQYLAVGETAQTITWHFK
jgi:hypothetical protein